ncbi:MAG: glycogen debranching protein GlgX [Deltaproteobacteria bacterium]|nr:glycogen debranching protein GlgX [Deltaproteobacteria bacterium]
MQIKSTARVTAGAYHPLGATITPTGVNFALYSKNATAVTLLLFDARGDAVPARSIPLENRTRHVWHAHVDGVRPGQLYGYKVDGPYDPRAGHRFNRHKLLVDPYAHALAGAFHGDPRLHLGWDAGSAFKDLSFSDLDNTGFAAKCVVVDDAFDWRGDVRPDIPFEDLIIYEAHVKGMTAHPSSGARFPGTYLGLIDKVPYLKDLGINAVELLPVHAHHTHEALSSRGLVNYWGYNTIGFFAPDARYAAGREAGAEVREFKELVRALHAAGIEVILDVVYNHTAEGDHLGPTLSFRGLDNAVYYQLRRDDPRSYVDFTGCGNTLDFDSPAVVKLVMDSLRYWVETMHVDGFRFDLASVLGRARGRFDQISSFFMAVHQDPIISRVKPIAEPWDIARDSYQVGNFPVDWSEWNGKYRDAVRRFAKSDHGLAPEMAYRLTGSSDLYGDDGRTPYNSVNFVTCHDGFTLHDLTAYCRKHNEANGEDNRDGNDDNASWNWGVEGETDDPKILAERRKVAANMMAMLLVSQGVPMILSGDEFLRTQGGNNNAYCQDNEISWIDWRLLDRNRGFFELTQNLVALRKRHPVLRKRAFFSGADRNLDGITDIAWFDENLGAPDWPNPEVRSLAFRMQGCEVSGDAAPGADPRDLYVIVNCHWNLKMFYLPPPSQGFVWWRAVDTSLGDGEDALPEGREVRLDPQTHYLVNGRSVVILVGK